MTDDKEPYNVKSCQKRCSLSSCKNLSYANAIDLSGCKLKKIPEEIKNASRMKSLNLSNNDISQIENLENAKNLEYLNLGVNNIEKIVGLDSLTNLKTIRLYDNNIDEIQGLHALSNLENIDLRYNNIEWIEGLGSQDKAKKIYLDGNPIQDGEERKLIDIGFEFNKVGYRLREEEIAKDLVDYSKTKSPEFIDALVEQMRRIAIKSFNKLIGI